MLEGLEISIKHLSEIKYDNPTLRFDSEYFKKEYLEIFSILYRNACKKMSILSTWITQGPNPNFDANGEIPCLTGRNINKGSVNYSDPDFVNSYEYECLKRFQLKKGDTLVTLKGKGSIGKIGYVTDERKAIFSRNIGVIRPKGIDSGFVNAFILSHYGKKILERGETGGTGQSTLTTEYLKNIDIPRLSIEKDIGRLVKLSEQVLNNSQVTYQQAEALLLETLGLINFQSTTDPVNVKSFKESFASTGRLDAEYYSPKYEEEDKIFEQYPNGYKLFRDLLESYEKGKLMDYSEDNSNINSKPYILINNLRGEEYSNFTLSQDGVYCTKDDFLIVGDGSKSGFVGTNVEGFVGSTLIKIKLRKDIKINKYSILCILRYYYERLNYFKTGSGVPHLDKSILNNLRIPLLDKITQNKIAESIEESFSLKKQSEQLLEKAKRAVEIAIEQNEQKAIEYINS